MRFKPAKERKRYKDIAMGTPSPYGQRMIKIEIELFFFIDSMPFF